MDRFTGNDAGGLDLHLAEAAGVDRSFTVDRLTNCVDNAADQGIADRNLGDAAGALDGIAFLDLGEFTENGGADVIFLQVEDHAGHTAREFQQLTGHGAGQTVDTGNTVTDGDDRAGFRHFNLFAILLDLLPDDLADLFRS